MDLIVGDTLVKLIARCVSTQESDAREWRVERLVLISTFQLWFSDLLSDDRAVHQDPIGILIQERSDAYRYFRQVFVANASTIDMLVVMTFSTTPSYSAYAQTCRRQHVIPSWENYAVHFAWSDNKETVAVRIQSRSDLDEVVNYISNAGKERLRRREAILQLLKTGGPNSGATKELEGSIITEAQVFLVPRM